MPLLRSKTSKPKDIVTADGSLLFTKTGILLVHPLGNTITVSASGIQMTCSGISVNVTPSQIVMNAGSVTMQIQMTDFTVNAGGFIRVNGTRVSVNNGALEVI